MTPHELRALADALPEGVHWSDPITPDMLAEAIRRFCADAEPVAWVQSNHLDEARRSVFMARLAPTQIYQDYVPLYAHPAPAVPAGWKLVPVEPTPEMLSAVGMMDGYDWHAPGCSPDADHANWYSAMLAAAPAAPQAEQPIDLDAVAMQQMRQAAAESTWMPSEYTSNDWIADVCRWLRDGPPAAAPQAEPSAALIRAYNSGYMQGHHDTVEAQFIVIHPLDMDTYHADVVAELGLTAAPQAEPMADSDADYWLRNRQPILDAIERAGFVLMSNASGFWLHPRGTTEAQIKARDALLDFISENGTASEGVQYYLDRYVRAALAAKEQK